jgi:uridine kinase
VYSAPVGTPLEDYFVAARRELIPPARQSGDSADVTAMAAVCNGTLRELTYPVQRDMEVQSITMHQGDGMRIYRRSLSFALRVAAHELFPEVKLTLDHALPFGGFYCKVLDGPPLADKQLDQLKTAIRDLIAENSPITRTAIPVEEAIALFRARGDNDRLRLMENRSKDYLIVYNLRGVQDYFYGYMVPSTGYLNVWDIESYGDGFLLRYPRRFAPHILQPVGDLGKLQQVFLEMARWLDLMEVEDIGRLNQAIRHGRARELILVAEALHEGSIADVADEIVNRQPDARLVLIAGPSSSGKTTFSKRLAIQLMAHGLKPFTLGLDDYFVDRDHTPLDEDGEFDFEHIETIDLDRFNHDLLALLAGKETQLPRFNFHTGLRETGEIVELTSDHVIIIEGIHGMNPALIREVPPERAFRIYASALTQLNIDRYNRVPTTDVRLLRRLVRDAAYRGYTAMDTLGRWESVRRGEKKWIFPYQENADVMFNSALVYELAVMRPLAEPLLRQVEPGTYRHVEAKRLLAFLSWVRPLEPDLIPDNSLLREFVGGSILRGYEPGEHITHKQETGGT